MKRSLLFVTFVTYLCLSQALLKAPHVSQRKQLAGPPSEFENHNLPNPSLYGVTSNSATLPVVLTQNGNVFSTILELPVDSDQLVTFSVMSPILNNLEVIIRAPQGEVNPVVEKSSYGMDGYKVPSVTYAYPLPVPGIWTLVITASGISAADLPSVKNPEDSDLYVIMFNQDQISMSASFTSYENLKEGNVIGLEASVYDPVKGRQFKLRDIIVEAIVEVELPDGQEEIVDMADDGTNGDLTADDAIFTANVPATEAGEYTANVVLRGVNPAGREFLRTSEHIIKVVHDAATIVGTATGTLSEDTVLLQIDIAQPAGISRQVKDKYETVRAYSEVWGKNDKKEDVPVAWVSTMADIQEVNGRTFVELQLNTNWIALAEASFPLTLRNTYIQDRDTFIPLSVSKKDIAVEMSAETRMAIFSNVVHALRQVRSRADVEISEQMIWGKRPSTLMWSNGQREFNQSVGADGTLVFVHGYCADGNPFTTSQFSGNLAAFSDPRSDRSNDDFALRIREQTAAYPSFGIVAHSQGGLASLHLHTFYWSGLETPSVAGRMIQSVGSPYQGTALAGSLATIGKIFGAGCGKQNDMTYDGAALWLSGIPDSTRAAVYYYTTQYSTSGLLHYCNLAANAVLAWPNDGVTENSYNQLSGANNMGNVKGWCHSDDMHDPNQTHDGGRNSILNANAQR